MPLSTRSRILVLIVAIVAVLGLVVAALWASGPTNGISVSVQGSRIVGTPLRFVIAAQGSPYPHWGSVRVLGGPFPDSQGVYLLLSGLAQGFDIVGGDAQSHPWGRPNIWNLTGLDLSRGQTFTLDTIPRWAAEMALWAVVFSPSSGHAGVRFVNGDMVNTSTAYIQYQVRVDVTTAWPLTATAETDTPMVLGQPTEVRISVASSFPGWTSPQALYLSVVSKPMYFLLEANGSSPNPWNATTLWNISTADLFLGVQVRLSATPMMVARGISFDVIVWSPRGTIDQVQLDQDGAFVNAGAVLLWMDTTVTFSVGSA